MNRLINGLLKNLQQVIAGDHLERSPDRKRYVINGTSFGRNLRLPFQIAIASSLPLLAKTAKMVLQQPVSLALLLVVGLILCARADVTPTAQDFTVAGTNRAEIQMDRRVYASRLDADFLMETLAKKNSGEKVPQEPKFLYQEVDPVPLRSEKVYTPWLDHFKQAVAFVIASLDPQKLKIARWSIRLQDEAGKEIKTFSGIGQPPQAFYWNGRDADYNPVEVGQGYIPEITLVDDYGAKVVLAQKKMYLDQFVWPAPGQLRAGFLQDSVFLPRQVVFSEEGNLIMRELSNLVGRSSAVLLDLEAGGQDPALSQERLEALQNYFSSENLHLKKIRLKKVAKSGAAVVYINAFKPGK